MTLGDDARLPEVTCRNACRGQRTAEEALDRGRRIVVDVAAVGRDLAGVHMLLEEVEDAREPRLAPWPPPHELAAHPQRRCM